MQGKVAWIENYGAFVDVGMPDGRTVSGMIHKSELSWGVVIVPDTVVSVGAPEAQPTHPCFLLQPVHHHHRQTLSTYILYRAASRGVGDLQGGGAGDATRPTFSVAQTDASGPPEEESRYHDAGNHGR